MLDFVDGIFVKAIRINNANRVQRTFPCLVLRLVRCGPDLVRVWTLASKLYVQEGEPANLSCLTNDQDIKTKIILVADHARNEEDIFKC